MLKRIAGVFPVLLGLLLLSLPLISCGAPGDNTESSEGICTPTRFGKDTGAETLSKMSIDTKEIIIENPLAPGADPWVTRRSGMYYYCYSTGNGVAVSAFASLAEFCTEGREVFSAPEGTDYSRDWWAPELHYIDGDWYIYVAADAGENESHRMYVLKGTSDDPTEPFTMVGQLKEPSGEWAIDGTVMKYGGELYFVWSGWEDNVGDVQYLFIAHMSSPTEIDGQRVKLSSPTYAWERVGMSIQEGPAALYHGEALYIVYSASGSWTDSYCLGMLTFKGGDVLDPACWEKSEKPVFSRGNRVYGVGHCSFTTSADGATVMFCHGMSKPGSGWGGREIFCQSISWEGDVPVFGKPTYTTTLYEMIYK